LRRPVVNGVSWTVCYRFTKSLNTREQIMGSNGAIHLLKANRTNVVQDSLKLHRAFEIDNGGFDVN
jgi:hypothetical protein